ncbi:MAG: hypothetical protein EA382_03845 [Spirochaetaceae bacterium]|nr:MAG: hypothetical protein EA382_03845 [Spirochaetaceae bacterium]
MTLLLIAVGATAQIAPPPYLDEAPETLLEFEIGAAEVDLFLIGSWRADSRLAAAWVLPGGRAIPRGPVSFPGMEPTIPLRNRVDLTLSLWLLERYFFETRIRSSAPTAAGQPTALADAIARSTVLFGYQGMPGEPLQSVRIGNTGIGIGAYPYLGIGGDPDPDDTAPGASVRLVSDRSVHEAMLRLSPAEEASLTYAGGGIVTERRVNASAFERARHFVLPDAQIDTLVVYTEAAASVGAPAGAPAPGTIVAGDGRRYHRVDLASETSFSLIDGLLSFRVAQHRRVLVWYTVAGTAIGDPSLGGSAYFARSPDGTPDASEPRGFAFASPDLDRYLETVSSSDSPQITIDDIRVSVPEGDAFVLYEPGLFSPFERLNHYPIDPSLAGRLVLETRLGAAVDNSLRFVAHPARNAVEVTASDDPRSFAARYPFASAGISMGDSDVYATGRSVRSRYDLVARSATTTDTITLPADYVPGSVRVTRNGRNETGFTVDATGTMQFDPPLTAADIVEVRYRVTGAGASDLLFAAGNRIAITPALTIDAGLAARFTPGSGRYTSRADESPGYIVASTQMEFDSTLAERRWLPTDAGEITATVRAALSASSADTTGVLRIDGMDDATTTVSIAPGRLFPASPPTVPPNGGGPLDASNRGKLLYRNYYRSEPFGGTSLGLYSPGAPPTAEPYAAGGRTGPYLALDATLGPVAVIEYQMPDGGDGAPTAEWVGAQVRLPADTDLSRVTALRIPYRFDGDPGATLFVQVGAVGDDVDADGVLDAGFAGFAFTDARLGVTLTAGIPEAGTLLSEDARGNGVLDPDLPDRIVTRPYSLVENAVWSEIEINLSMSERRALAGAPSRPLAVRFIVQRVSPGPLDGTLAIGRIELGGSDFDIATPGAPQTPAPVVTVERVDETTTRPLSSDFPDVAKRFSDRDRPNRVLRARWTGISTGTVELRTPVAVAASSYRSMRIYARNAGSTTVTVALSAVDEGGRTIASAQAAVEPGPWVAVDVPLAASDPAVIAAIVVAASGADSGELYLDELTFWDARGSVGIVASADFDWKPLWALSADGYDLIDNIRLRHSMSARSTGFADGLAAEPVGLSTSSRVDASVLGADISAGVDTLIRSESTGFGSHHTLTVPLFDQRMTISDAFRRETGALGERAHHQSSAAATIGLLGTASVLWSTERTVDRVATWRVRAATSASADSIELSLDERTALDPDRERPGYAAEWVDTLGDIVTDRAAYRRHASFAARTRIDQPIDRVPVGFSATIDGATTASSTTRRQEVALGGSIGFPVTIANGATIAPIAERSIRLSQSGSATSVGDDIASGASILRAAPVAFTMIPIAELIDDEFTDRFAAATSTVLFAQYTPVAGVELTRRTVSSPWSLIVPTTARVTFARPAVRDLDSASASHQIDARAGFFAPNLFGRLGSVGLFGFYDTDEFQTRARLLIDRGDDGSIASKTDLNSRVDIAWRDGRSARVAQVVKVTTPATTFARADLSLDTVLRYRWRTARRSAVRTTGWLDGLPDGAFFEHEERVTLRWDRAASSMRSAFIAHDSALVLPGGSRVRAYAGLGVASYSGPAEYSILGFEIGIEGTLRF